MRIVLSILFEMISSFVLSTATQASFVLLGRDVSPEGVHPLDDTEHRQERHQELLTDIKSAWVDHRQMRLTLWPLSVMGGSSTPSTG